MDKTKDVVYQIMDLADGQDIALGIWTRQDIREYANAQLDNEDRLTKEELGHILRDLEHVMNSGEFMTPTIDYAIQAIKKERNNG